MRIAIDLDGVCYDFTAAFRRTVRRHRPGMTSTDMPDATRWEFYKDWGLTTNEFFDLCSWGIKDRIIFGKGVPFTGTQEALETLRSRGDQIVFVTDRANLDPNQSDLIKDLTCRWLDRHRIMQTQDELHFEGDKTKVDWDVLLDDKVENYDAALAAGRDCWLFDRPYNRDTSFLSTVIRNRVKTWFQFIQRMEERRNKLLRPSGILTVPSKDEVQVTSSTGGTKGVKLARFDLIPAKPMWKVAEVYGLGSRKYADRNWENGYPWSLSYGALQRHLNQFWQGESIDPDGQHHLASVVFHALALMEYENTHPGHDDRPKRVTDD